MKQAMLLDKIVALTNTIAHQYNGSRDTCILTSYALTNVLLRKGFNAYPVRIEAAIYPNDRKFSGVILGSRQDSISCRRAAAKDHWKGHLAVAIDEDWLLDPTLDQANRPEWHPSVCVGPACVKLKPIFWEGKSQWGRFQGPETGLVFLVP